LPNAGALVIDCHGEHLHLLPERGVWWPAQEALLVADVHLGKAATFRALGQPVPSGTTLANLQRLESLIRRLGASRLIVLGDFLHAPESRSAAVIEALAAWRARLTGVRCTVVEGNHDRRAGALPAELAIERVSDPLTLGPFKLSHGDRRKPGGYALEGHLHPAYVLRGRAGERLRLPCFRFGKDSGVLPAFGEFTGHMNVAVGEGDRVFVIGDGRVWPVPAAKDPSS
jgi:DNA ligase-associated metallophosphoesterase